MTDRRPNAPVETIHSTVRYEIRDVNATRILGSLAFLAVVLVLAVTLLWPLYIYLQELSVSGASPISPLLADQPRQLPPEPRLQGSPGHEVSPQLELLEMRDQAEERLNSYRWIDREQGIARIPVEAAMRLLAENPDPAREELSPAPAP